ncbi:MAG: ATP-binding protein [Fuerstiella sp.]|nr:ATP-binding protein [Fuerstiella sp.]
MFGRAAKEKDWKFDAEGQTEAVNRLLYVVENGEGFALLKGSYGTGKSTVMQQTAHELASLGRQVVRQNMTSLDCRASLWHLCGALSVFSHTDTDTSALMMMIRDELLARASCHHQTVVLLDDADFAQEDIGSVLHLLTSIAESSAGRLSVIASAEQPMAFSLQKHTSLNVRLDPLSEQEAIEFVVRRLAHLECPVDGVTDTGWRAIAHLGGGLPAQLLRICEIVHVVTSMQPGPIDATLVHEAATELMPQAA